MFLPHPLLKLSIVGSLCDQEVAFSASDLQGLNFYYLKITCFVWNYFIIIIIIYIVWSRQQKSDTSATFSYDVLYCMI